MISIRKAILSDAPAIIGFQISMAWETEKMNLVPDIVEKGVRAVFSNPLCGQYWVAEEDDKVIASLLITFEWSDWRNTNVWWFQSVYVIPEYRRRGIFRTMFLTIKEKAGVENAAGLRLYVETNNLQAQFTYQSLGMQSEHYKMYEWMKE